MFPVANELYMNVISETGWVISAMTSELNILSKTCGVSLKMRNKKERMNEESDKAPTASC